MREIKFTNKSIKTVAEHLCLEARALIDKFDDCDQISMGDWAWRFPIRREIQTLMANLDDPTLSAFKSSFLHLSAMVYEMKCQLELEESET